MVPWTSSKGNFSPVLCTVAFTNNKNMHVVSTDQIADILHFIDKSNYDQVIWLKFLSWFYHYQTSKSWYIGGYSLFEGSSCHTICNHQRVPPTNDSHDAVVKALYSGKSLLQLHVLCKMRICSYRNVIFHFQSNIH